jgi:hypothetical protein
MVKRSREDAPHEIQSATPAEAENTMSFSTPSDFQIQNGPEHAQRIAKKVREGDGSWTADFITRVVTSVEQSKKSRRPRTTALVVLTAYIFRNKMDINTENGDVDHDKLWTYLKQYEDVRLGFISLKGEYEYVIHAIFDEGFDHDNRPLDDGDEEIAWINHSGTLRYVRKRNLKNLIASSKKYNAMSHNEARPP